MRLLSQTLQTLKLKLKLMLLLQEAAYHHTDHTALCYGINLCSLRTKARPWMYPEWTGCQSSLHHPESRCFLRLSYHKAIHATQIAVSPFLRGSAASLRPAALHSASAAGTA